MIRLKLFPEALIDMIVVCNLGNIFWQFFYVNLAKGAIAVGGEKKSMKSITYSVAVLLIIFIF